MKLVGHLCAWLAWAELLSQGDDNYFTEKCVHWLTSNAEENQLGALRLLLLKSVVASCEGSSNLTVGQPDSCSLSRS